MNKQNVVITGVSTGIGWGTTKVLVEKGAHVFGSVRKPADAERLKQEFGALFTPLLFDITDEAAVQQAAGEVRAALAGGTLFGLVNNAGIGVAGPLQHLSIADFRHQFEVNLVGQLIVTQAFLPLLGTDRSLHGAPGRIVNISSTGGKFAAPFSGPYAASKHALEGFSEALRRELMIFGIDVIIVAPGFIDTPIWEKVDAIDISPYAGTEYFTAAQKTQQYYLEHGRKGLPPERVGEVVWQALVARKPRVRYPVVPDPALNWLMNSLLPRRWFDRLIAKRFGLERR